MDAKIVELTEDDGGLADKIEQADTCKEALYESILKVDKVLNIDPTVHATRGIPLITAQAMLKHACVNRVKLLYCLELLPGCLFVW